MLDEPAPFVSMFPRTLRAYYFALNFPPCGLANRSAYLAETGEEMAKKYRSTEALVSLALAQIINY